MVTKTIKSLGLDVTFSVPSSVEEFDKNAKRQGACLEEAVRNVLYRSTLADFRDAFTDKLVEVTKIPMKTKDSGKKDEKGNVILLIDETEDKYFDRVCAELKKQRTDFQALANEVAKTLTFDASATERKSGPKALPATYRTTATQLFDNKQHTKAAANITKKCGYKVEFTGDRAKDIEALGWAIQAYEAWRRQQTVSELVG